MTRAPVSLRSPVTREDLAAWPDLEAVLLAIGDDFAPRAAEALWAVCQRIDAAGGNTWVVRAADEVLGCITFTPVNGISGAVHIVLPVFDPLTHPELAAAAREAIVLALSVIFRELPYQRVTFALLFEDEATFPLLVLLNELGAWHEGILRGATVKQGITQDVVLLGLRAAEFNDGSPASAD